VRAVKFIARKNWFIAGSDDSHLRVFNYNSQEQVAAFPAHSDFIRGLAVHPSASIVLSGSDDKMIKAWDWDQGWKNVQIYEGHAHYIMNLVFNPQDPSSFLSSSLDGSVKLWSAGSSSPKFSLQAHEQGVNYVDFYPGADKPYLVTASDDKTVKVWDYRSKSCVHVLEGHASKVSFAIFHPNLPIIISGSEDGTVKIWNLGDYHAESSLNYGLERSWCVALHKHSNEVAVGFDAGVVVLKLGA